MTNEQKQQIGALRKRGFGYLKIGQALCISGNTVRSFYRRNGFDTAAMANTAQCMQCGAPLKWKAGHREKKFCSAVCRAQWWNTHLDCVNRKDAMLHSLSAQVSHYSKYMQNHDGWLYVGVYADEATSGTKENRDEFQRLLADCRSGKVDSKGELLITIMSSLAQEESRSISENITWGQRKRFSDGKVNMPYKRFLGYEKGEDGLPQVNEEEAQIVRLIYGLFLAGKTAVGICKYLEQHGIPSPGGKQKWSKTTITSILSNEKYKGDALLQKKFTVDFLQKKMKTNEGEVQQYYVEHSHPAIIEPVEWERVQAETARRKALGKAYSGSSVFSARLVCADCGGFYGQKVWHSTDAYRKVIWRCNSKFNGDKTCNTPTLAIETIQSMFLTAYNRLMETRDSVIADCEMMREMRTDFTTIDAEINQWQEELAVIAELVKACISENASTAKAQEEYEKKYNRLAARYEEAAKTLDRLNAERTRRQEQLLSMTIFIESLKMQPTILDVWDDTLWSVMIDKGIVHKSGSITFVFRSGSEIEVEPEK